MSLILEALRKSEERRRLGETPTLISESAWSSRRKHPLARRPRRWLLVLPLLALAAFAGWWLGFRGQREAAPAAAATSAPRAPAPMAEKPERVRGEPASVAPAVPQSLPQSAEDAAASANLDPATRERFERGEVFANSPAQLGQVAPTKETPYVPPEAALPEPLPENKPEPVAVAPALAPAAAPVAAAAVPPAATATAAPAPEPQVPLATAAAPPQPAVVPAAADAPAAQPATSAVPLVWELPVATRRELPPMQLSMHVYAVDPARRFAWVDDKRVSEGSPLKNELDVVEITPEGVVLEFRGQRFLLPRAGR